MKTLVRFSAALLLTGSLITACQPDEPSTASVQTASTDAKARASCGKIVLPTVVYPNQRRVGSNCVSQPGWICIRPGRIIQIPCVYYDFPELRIPPVCLSCPPIEIIRRIPDYRFDDFRRINPELIREGVNALQFPVTPYAIGIQFYAEDELMNRKGFTLRAPLSLTAEEQRALGVSGSVIPAGSYPVAFNPKNNTFNAILAVAKQ